MKTMLLLMVADPVTRMIEEWLLLPDVSLRVKMRMMNNMIKIKVRGCLVGGNECACECVSRGEVCGSPLPSVLLKAVMKMMKKQSKGEVRACV
jgi:hypothetical protein